MARRLAHASNVHSCSIRKCFVVRKEDADNEAKPLPPANINHTEKKGEGLNIVITVFYDVKLLAAQTDERLFQSFHLVCF